MYYMRVQNTLSKRENIIVTIRISPKDLDEIDKICKKYSELNRSSIIRIAIRNFLQQTSKTALKRFKKLRQEK
jgi:metal-responsive CopG/Arc/MetJ family transcriptional regulator